jgi:threonine dehydratase
MSEVATRISLSRIEAGLQRIDRAFLATPQFHSAALSDRLGSHVVLKIETINPLGSFKGRGADLFVSSLTSSSQTLVCASAGNFGQALAYSGRKRGLPVVVFAAETASPTKIDRMRGFGADVRLYGRDLDEAKHAAAAFAREAGARFVEDGREVAISEGAGTMGVEICNGSASFDLAVLPLGNGALLAGVGTWLKHKSPETRVIGVCAAGAQAMATSWRTGNIEVATSVSTIADGIAVRVPVPEALDDLKGVVDDILIVEDDAIRRAMRIVFECHSLITEPAGAAGLAAVIAYANQFRGARVITPLCGANLTMQQAKHWILE